MEFCVKLLSKDKEKVIYLQTEPLQNGDFLITVNADAVGEGFEYADIFYDTFRAKETDTGYYVIPDLAGGRLVRFKKTEKGGSHTCVNHALRMIGCTVNGTAYVGKIVGMSDEYRLISSKENGEYRYFLRFILEGRKPYEDIKIILHKSVDTDFDYNKMAIWYREKGFESGEITPLAEKIKLNPTVKYAAESVNIRIRMAWKPAPSKVLEQTKETEPPVKIACTFKMVEDLLDELKAFGVEKADICLVGWNISGHDGRWPEMFPVEPKLGGEQGLKNLLKKAETLGYMINLHTNFTDAYSIAENFSEDIIIKKPDGSLAANFPWSGGTMYDVAVKYIGDTFIKDLEKLKKLGVKGMHYTDVVSAVAPRRSYDERFPMTPKEYTGRCKELLNKARDIFGGISSEAGMDHVIDALDYVLYAEFPDHWNRQDLSLWMDEVIPLWFIVYHGSVLYNADNKSINHIIKEKDKGLRMVEVCARPAVYCFVDFIDGLANWGSEDFVWKENEKPTEIAKAVAKTQKHYDKYRHLTCSLIKSYKRIDDVSKIIYENDTVVTVDYNSKEYNITELK